MKRANRRGFSLVEVMVSSLLLGLGVAALVELFTSSSSGLRISRNRSVATQLALQRLEQLAAFGIDGLPGCGFGTGCREGITTLAAPQSAAAGFDCTQLVSDTGFSGEQAGDQNGRFRVDVSEVPHPDPNQIPGATLLRVSVCWSDRGNTIQQVQLERLVVPEV
ncbi:MAG: prepilin-type N-terminal cleavage/methylation domain-containing protein [Myxococcota bacterium]